MIKHLGLTGRILFSFWVTLILVVISMPIIFWVDRNTTDVKPEIPPIELNDRLTLKLLTEDYSTVKTWFAQQPKRFSKRIYVQYRNEEILGRELPRSLRRISDNLSSSRPFIHRQRFDQLFVGRYLLMPNGEYARILIRTHMKPPPGHGPFRDNVIGIVLMAIVISGLISFVLAKHIAGPIKIVRAATRQFASGDLSIRVKGQLKPSHDEVYGLAEDFDSMAERLEKTISSHKHLIQDISHELRSPIARLQLALALAKKKLKLSDDQEDFLRIEKECEQLNTIINTLLNLPAYELDPQVLRLDKHDLVACLNDVCQDLRYAHPHIAIQFDHGDQEHVAVPLNEPLFRSAVENILKNAITYHNGSDPIEVTLNIKADSAVVEFSDRGPGIDDSKLDDIFKPFYRISEARDRRSGGYGLGLAITKRAIDLHDGIIRAHNRTGGGLTVHIEIPIKVSSASP